MEKEVNVGKIAIWLVVILLAVFLVVKFSDVTGGAVQSQDNADRQLYYDKQIVLEKEKLASLEKQEYTIKQEINSLEKEKSVANEKNYYDQQIKLRQEKINSIEKERLASYDNIIRLEREKISLLEKEKLASNEKTRYENQINIEKGRLAEAEKEKYEKQKEKEYRQEVKPVSRENIIKMFNTQKVINVKFEDIIKGPTTCRDVCNKAGSNICLYTLAKVQMNNAITEVKGTSCEDKFSLGSTVAGVSYSCGCSNI